MRIQPKEGMSVSLQKFHRQSVMSQASNGMEKQEQLLPLPELKVRGLKSANLKQSPKRTTNNPIKFYVHDMQCVVYDDLIKRRGDNHSEYVFVDTYLEALNYVSQEQKMQKLHSNAVSIVSESFVEQQKYQPRIALNLPPAQQMRDRMKKYAEGKQKEVVKIYIKKDIKRNAKTSVSLLSQKSLQENIQQRNLSLHLNQNIPPIKNKISAKKWCIYIRKSNETEFKKIHGWQDQMKCEVASITKIMTCYTTLSFLKEHRLTADQIKIKIPGHAECIDGTSAFLNAGGILTIQQLFYALMLPSGNDAALVLSFAVAFLMIQQRAEPHQFTKYSRGMPIDCETEIEKNKKLLKHTFLDKMNFHREQLKMEQSYYHSVHGLNDPKNVSCASNIVKLIEKCIEIPEFMEIINKKIVKTNALNEKGEKSTFYKWKNTNKLLKKEGWAGVKTGVTQNAGPCYSGYYKQEQFEAIIVVLNSSNMNQRFKDAEILLQSVKQQY